MNRKKDRNPLEAIKEISRRVSQNKTENLSQNKKKSTDGKKAPSKKDVLKPVEEKKKTGKPDPETKTAGKQPKEKRKNLSTMRQGSLLCHRRSLTLFSVSVGRQREVPSVFSAFTDERTIPKRISNF